VLFGQKYLGQTWIPVQVTSEIEELRPPRSLCNLRGEKCFRGDRARVIAGAGCLANSECFLYFVQYVRVTSFLKYSEVNYGQRIE